MILDFDTLGRRDFRLSNVKLVRRAPSYRTCSLQHRRYSGFIYIISGECTFQSHEQQITLAQGGLIYLPEGTKHTMTVKSQAIEFYRIDFNVTVGDEIALFSDRPVKLSDAVSGKCRQTMEELRAECESTDNGVVKTEKLCALFAALFLSPAPAHCNKLTPAIRYLEEHYCESVSCRNLAALCFLSTAQFYNLFRAHVGTTPLGYRDRLLLRHAKSLLETAELTVSEIAERLGFSDGAYFSRFFKKHTGLSPAAYAAQNRDF